MLFHLKFAISLLARVLYEQDLVEWKISNSLFNNFIFNQATMICSYFQLNFGHTMFQCPSVKFYQCLVFLPHPSLPLWHIFKLGYYFIISCFQGCWFYGLNIDIYHSSLFQQSQDSPQHPSNYGLRTRVIKVPSLDNLYSLVLQFSNYRYCSFF